MRQYKTIFAIALLALFLSGCAFDLAHVQYNPCFFSPKEKGKGISFSLNETVLLTQTPCGYSRTLKADSRWVEVGSIPEGLIFKPINQTLTIECSNVFEAYIVLSDFNMVGFFLPVQKGFVPISKPILLPIQKEEGS